VKLVQILSGKRTVMSLAWGNFRFFWEKLLPQWVTSNKRSLNKYSYHGPTINPYEHPSGKIEKRYSGGSSGGSAAAVASGMCQV